jgi:hypothetical protein
VTDVKNLVELEAQSDPKDNARYYPATAEFSLLIGLLSGF